MQLLLVLHSHLLHELRLLCFHAMMCVCQGPLQAIRRDGRASRLESRQTAGAPGGAQGPIARASQGARMGAIARGRDSVSARAVLAAADGVERSGRTRVCQIGSAVRARSEEQELCILHSAFSFISSLFLFSRLSSFSQRRVELAARRPRLLSSEALGARAEARRRERTVRLGAAADANARGQEGYGAGDQVVS